MKKIFDIKPPQPKTNYKFPKKNKDNNKIFIIILLLFIIYFSINNRITSNYNEEYKPPNNTAYNNQSKEISEETETSKNVNNNPAPTTSGINKENISQKTKHNENIILEILNGSQMPGLANEAKNILEADGIKVANIGNTINNYQKSIIYYTEKNFEYVNEIKLKLADYSPEIEINNELANDEKILIIIVK